MTWISLEHWVGRRDLLRERVEAADVAKQRHMALIEAVQAAGDTQFVSLIAQQRYLLDDLYRRNAQELLTHDRDGYQRLIIELTPKAVGEIYVGDFVERYGVIAVEALSVTWPAAYAAIKRLQAGIESGRISEATSTWDQSLASFVGEEVTA